MRAASHSGIPEAESLLLAWPRHRRGKFGIEIEGFAAKHLRTKGKKAMEINWAGVLELVDRRDLKFVAPFEIHRIFCITRPENKTKIDAKRRDLHNARIAALAALPLTTAPAFGQAVAPHCDTWCTAFAWLGGVFEAAAPHGILAVTALLLWAARRRNDRMEI